MIQNSIKIPLEEIAEKLNRSIKAVKWQCFSLGLNSFSNKIHTNFVAKWSEKDIDFLKENSDLDPLILGFLLNRSFRSIDHKLEELGLKNKEKNKKTRIEVIVEDILIRNNMAYNYNLPICSTSPYRPDFYLFDFNLVIECQGDYWHGNPYLYSEEELNEIQINVKWKDMLKKEFYEEKNIKALFFWETEILFEGFESILMNKILDCKSNIAVLGSDT